MFKKLLKSIKINESTISMVLGALVVIVIGSLVFNYFKSIKGPTSESLETLNAAETVVTETPSQTDLPRKYIVKAGDCLWKIAESVYGSGYNWIDIAKDNQLVNPNVILIGQEINLPRAEIRKPVSPQANISPIGGDTYTVVKGDNLWDISVRAYQDGYKWPQVASDNKIANPNLIYPGDVIKLSR